MRTAFDLITAAKYLMYTYFHLSRRLQCRGFGEMREVGVMCYSVHAWQYCKRYVNCRLVCQDSGDGRICRA
jgi:hypothetical protein